MPKTIQQIIATFLLFLIIVSIAFFLIYPNYSTIQLTYNQFNFKDIARNTSLKILTQIGQPPTNDLIIHSKTEPIVENISPDVLLKYQNEGNIIDYLEPLDTTLSIPSANIYGRVFDGYDANTLYEGMWHFPLTPAPGKKGNAVIIAHRFDKMPPDTDTFFNLDWVQVGDKIQIKQNNGSYTFVVTEVKIVDQTDRSILEQTQDYRITLVTCTPLWTDYQRLVVIGKLDKVYGDI
jgi:LPXTG-site transpeptidase (sortase) family protein